MTLEEAILEDAAQKISDDIDKQVLKGMGYVFDYYRNPESYHEGHWDKDFENWLCPIYRCRIKVRKKDGSIRWFEFDNDQDAIWFKLRWS